MTLRSITLTPAGMSSTGVGTRVAVTTIPSIERHRWRGWRLGVAGVSAVLAEISATNKKRRKAVSIERGPAHCGPVAGTTAAGGSLSRCPGAPRPLRARSLDAGRSPGLQLGIVRRPVRLLVPHGTMALDQARRLQLRGQPRTNRRKTGFARSRFSPCGPPASRTQSSRGAGNAEKDGFCAPREGNDYSAHRVPSPYAGPPLSGIRVARSLAPRRWQHGQPASR